MAVTTTTMTTRHAILVQYQNRHYLMITAVVIGIKTSKLTTESQSSFLIACPFPTFVILESHLIPVITSQKTPEPELLARKGPCGQLQADLFSWVKLKTEFHFCHEKKKRKKRGGRRERRCQHDGGK